MVIESTRGRAIRVGDWKLALCPGSGCDGTYGNTPKRQDAWNGALESFGRRPKSQDDLGQAPFVQLFNLRSDPSESSNLAAKNPDRVRRMLDLLRKQIDAGRSTPGPSLANDRKNIPLFFGVPEFVWRDAAQPSR